MRDYNVHVNNYARQTVGGVADEKAIYFTSLAYGKTLEEINKDIEKAVEKLLG